MSDVYTLRENAPEIDLEGAIIEVTEGDALLALKVPQELVADLIARGALKPRRSRDAGDEVAHV